MDKNATTESPQLFRLKLRYQGLLLWMPVVVFIAGVALGMYVAAWLIAPALEVNLDAPLASQERGVQLFWSTMVAGLVAGAFSATVYYAALAIWMRHVARWPWGKIKATLRGSTYPQAWF